MFIKPLINMLKLHLFDVLTQRDSGKRSKKASPEINSCRHVCCEIITLQPSEVHMSSFSDQ